MSIRILHSPKSNPNANETLAEPQTKSLQVSMSFDTFPSGLEVQQDMILSMGYLQYGHMHPQQGYT